MSTTDEQMRRMLYGRAAEERDMARQGMPGRWEPVPDPASPAQQVMAQAPWPETIDGVGPMVVQTPWPETIDGAAPMVVRTTPYTPTPAQQVMVGAGVNAGIAAPAPPPPQLTPDQTRGRELDAQYRTATSEVERLLGLQREFLPQQRASEGSSTLGSPSESPGIMQALASQIQDARARQAAIHAERNAFIDQQRAAAQRNRDQVRLRDLGLIDPSTPIPRAAASAPASSSMQGEGAAAPPAYLTPNAPATPAAPAAPAASAAPAAASASPAAAPSGVTTRPPPASVTTVSPQGGSGVLPSASLGLPSDGLFTVHDRRGLPVALQCTSGVCSPDIQVGDFYANATQSGFASSGTSERDRYYDAAVRQRVAGGPQGVLNTEMGDRAMGVQDMRMSPAYQQLYAQNLQVTGNDAQAAQALTDVSFRQAAATRAPGLSLGLSEQDITPAIDNLMAQRAGMALSMGDPTFSNPVADAAASVGYFGGAGALPYGTADGPAVRTAGGIQGMLNVPESYAAPAMAQSGGVEGMLGRADATEQSIQRILAAAGGSGSASNALTALRINNPEAYQQMIYNEELTRALARAEGRGNTGSILEQLMDMQATR